VISAYGIGQAQSWLHPRIQRAGIYTVAIAVIASLLSLVLSLNWEFDSPPSDFFRWPGIVYWFSVAGVWLVVGLGAWIAVRRFRPTTAAGESRGSVTAVFAMSISALVLTSVFTRPAVLWTESRPLNTDIGVVTPNTNSGSAGPISSVSGSLIADQIAATDWISANTDRSDQIATNAPVSALIPALTGNQMYLAGSRYQAGLGDASQVGEVARRGEISGLLSAAVISDPSQQAKLAQLCDAGVAYLWIEGPATTILVQPEFSNELISIYSLEFACTEFLSN
jgi:hypothetical protein